MKIPEQCKNCKMQKYCMQNNCMKDKKCMTKDLLLSFEDDLRREMEERNRQ